MFNSPRSVRVRSQLVGRFSHPPGFKSGVNSVFIVIPIIMKKEWRSSGLHRTTGRVLRARRDTGGATEKAAASSEGEDAQIKHFPREFHCLKIMSRNSVRQSIIEFHLSQ